MIGQLERVIGKSEKKGEKFEVNTSKSIKFNEAEEILDGKYLEKIEDEEEDLKEIEEEYNFLHIFSGVIPEDIEFYFGGDNKNFFLTCISLDLNSDNEYFVDFLPSDFGYKIMTENKITIHIKTRNIYFDKTNANKFLYDFCKTQQDKKLIKKLINDSFYCHDDYKIFNGN